MAGDTGAVHLFTGSPFVYTDRKIILTNISRDDILKP